MGTFFWMEAERSYHFDHWLHVSKISLPSDFMHIVHDFIHVYSCGRDRQPIWAKLLMSTERPHHFNPMLYTSFNDLINVCSPGAGVQNPRGTKF